MPAYNAAQTLRKTWDEVMAQEIVDLIIVVDDKSKDETVSIAKALPDTFHYGSPGLSVYTQVDSCNGFHDRERFVSLCSGLTDSRWLCFKGRDAGMEIHCQSFSYFCRKYSDGC